MKDLAKLEEKIGGEFKDKNLITQAVIHRSYLNEHAECQLDHNERLEFLGDAVLELIITEYLYKNFDNPEGDLTNWRASLVNSASLAQIAKELDIEPHLYLSRGESKDKNPKGKQYILANALEAIIGAIYLDRGVSAAKKFIKKNVLTKLDDILANKLYIDAKSYFQEKAQDELGVTPSYRVLESSGPDHDKIFVVGVFIGDEMIAKGSGSSKQEAQTEAAKNGLIKKNWRIA